MLPLLLRRQVVDHLRAVVWGLQWGSNGLTVVLGRWVRFCNFVLGNLNIVLKLGMRNSPRVCLLGRRI